MAGLANHAAAMRPSVHSVETATSQLSELIEAALSGDEVVIAKDGKPAVRLVPPPQSEFRLGILKGKVNASPDFLEPMSEDDLLVREGR